jgi:hypothetical protein
MVLPPLADWTTSWLNPMHEFHDNLSQHYVKYLESHPRPNGNNFVWKKMNVLDMTSDADRTILTTHDAFHKQYTDTGTPVVLCNVNLTNVPVTVQYWV